MNQLQTIANDTLRTPAERDLARILNLATLLLEKGDINKSKDILKIYLGALENQK